MPAAPSMWVGKIDLREAIAHLSAIRLEPTHALDAKDREALRIALLALNRITL